MKRSLFACLAVLLLSVFMIGSANAAIIDFTGGTVYSSGGTTSTTNGTTAWSADYYVEDGFKLDFIGGDGIVGNYYGTGNDIIHNHWSLGDFGSVTEVKVTRVDGAAFDLNYFVLTSNTMTGGAAASGTELAYIHASIDGINTSYSQLLPPDDWGFAGTNPQIWLGSQFDNIKSFSFTVANGVDCFGMDNFYINEAAPPVPTPIPPAVWLLGSGLVGLVGLRRKFKFMK